MTNPKMTKVDLAWTFAFLGIFFSMFVLSLIVAIFYLIPLTLDDPNTLPRQGNDGIIKIVIVSASFAFGIISPTSIICLISRRYNSPETYERWVLQFANGKDRIPKFNSWLGSYLLKKMKPNGGDRSL